MTSCDNGFKEKKIGNQFSFWKPMLVFKKANACFYHLAFTLQHHAYDKGLKNTVKPVYNSHSKIDKTKILMTNGSLLKVESIAECSPWSILQYF